MLSVRQTLAEKRQHFIRVFRLPSNEEEEEYCDCDVSASSVTGIVHIKCPETPALQTVKILASVSFGVHAVCLNREKRCAWTMAKRCRCLVVCLTSSFRTWWYHLIPNNFCRCHWLRASILSASFLVTAQHSEPHRRMGSSTWLKWKSPPVIRDRRTDIVNVLFTLCGMGM